MDMKSLDVPSLMKLYNDIIKELKDRKILRTNNVIGELGEFLAMEYFNTTKGLPKLQAAPIITQNVDAISRDGERYTIKATSTQKTGTFYGLQPKGSDKTDSQCFEYVLICKFNSNSELEAIYQLDWNNFLKHKCWNSRIQAWDLRLTKSLKADSTLIFEMQTAETDN